jgi:hypothetical protein
MAWRHKLTGKGPYPLHACEYCGNWTKGSRAFRQIDQTQAEADELQRKYLSRMRFGRPRPCPQYKTVEEAEAAGLVGLYFNSTGTPMSWEQEVPTPPELTEPGAERLYNVDGKPGICKLHTNQ